MPIGSMSVYFFLQAAVIIVASQLVGRIARLIGQPQVVGEMIAGVMLGPSLFGLLAPAWQATVFPVETRGTLYVFGQLGVGLYMFLVGSEFRTDHFKAGAKAAVGVSFAGIAVPFILAILLTPWLLTVPGLYSPKVKLVEAALFLGAAIAITAFPMLARIIQERGLAGTRIGALALTAGAMDDAAAWCILAIVLASFSGNWGGAYLAIGGGITFAVVMIFLGQTVLARVAHLMPAGLPMPNSVLALLFAIFCLCAFLMDAIGIHAVFGGFLLGCVLPRGELVERLQTLLRPFVVVFLLPMFFTYSGLNTRLDMLFSPGIMAAALAILMASFGGKLVACWGVARLTGVSSQDAIALGALMNARGLMELILINIGLSVGVILPGLFSILVLMAVVSTLMATPIFNWAAERKRPALSNAAPA